MNPSEFLSDDLFTEEFPLLDKMIQRIETEVTCPLQIKSYYNIGNLPSALLYNLTLLTENTLSGKDTDLSAFPIILVVSALNEVLRSLKLRLIHFPSLPKDNTELEYAIQSCLCGLSDNHNNLIQKILDHFKAMNDRAQNDVEAQDMLRKRILGRLLPLVDYNDNAEKRALEKFIQIFDSLDHEL